MIADHEIEYLTPVLPGLDVLGLRVTCVCGLSTCLRVSQSDCWLALWNDPLTPEPRLWYVHRSRGEAWIEGKHARVSVLHASTRFALARAIAARVSPAVPTHRGVQFSAATYVLADGPRWFLRGDGASATDFGATIGWRRVPGLARLDPADDTRLPDGSRRVDALALRMIYEADPPMWLDGEVPRG